MQFDGASISETIEGEMRNLSFGHRFARFWTRLLKERLDFIYLFILSVSGPK